VISGTTAHNKFRAAIMGRQMARHSAREWSNRPDYAKGRMTFPLKSHLIVVRRLNKSIGWLCFTCYSDMPSIR
jgi:hypothetical protein